MLGLTRKEVERRFDEIVDFAELRDFIDAPVKTYSSGMYMRLGFAVAIHVDPDVLLIDEVLAVGDEAFTRKCLDKIAEFRRRGKTILFVTHSLGLVEKMCDDALWLRHGQTADRGDPKRVVDAYLTYVAGGEEALLRSSQAAAAERARGGRRARAPRPARRGGAATGYRRGRWGSREVEIRAVRLLDARGRERHVFVPGETVTLALSRPRGDARRRLRVRGRPLLRGGHERLRHQHRHRGLPAAADRGRGGGPAHARRAEPRRGHVPRRRRRPPSRRDALRLPARASTPSA